MLELLTREDVRFILGVAAPFGLLFITAGTFFIDERRHERQEAHRAPFGRVYYYTWKYTSLPAKIIFYTCASAVGVITILSILALLTHLN